MYSSGESTLPNKPDVFKLVKFWIGDVDTALLALLLEIPVPLLALVFALDTSLFWPTKFLLLPVKSK